uniref:Uncharacterized protein n=1 Tax=Panagrolaimus superbus TaxID=310955 RepID=A0A914YU11_9BILA
MDVPKDSVSSDNSTLENSEARLPPTNAFPTDQMQPSNAGINIPCEKCSQIFVSMKLADAIKLSNDIKKLEIMIKNKPPGRPLKNFIKSQADGSRKMATTKYGKKIDQKRRELKKNAEDLMETNKALKEMIKVNQSTFSPVQKQQIVEILYKECNLLKESTSEIDDNKEIRLSQTPGATAKRRFDRKKRNEKADWEKKVQVLPMIHKELHNVFGVIDWMGIAASKTAMSFQH